MAFEADVKVKSFIWFLELTMYICLCRAITDKDIEHAAQHEGVCTLKQLCCKLGVAQQCGKCAPYAKEVLENALPSLDDAIAS